MNRSVVLTLSHAFSDEVRVPLSHCEGSVPQEFFDFEDGCALHGEPRRIGVAERVERHFLASIFYSFIESEIVYCSEPRLADFAELVSVPVFVYEFVGLPLLFHCKDLFDG